MIVSIYIYIIYYNIYIYYIHTFFKNNNYNNEKHRVHAVQKDTKKTEDPRTRGLDARSSALATNPSWNSNELL